MTNLEAFIKAHGWKGGTIHQMDIVYRDALRKAGFTSITNLLDMSDWLDFLVIIFDEVRSGNMDKNAYHRCKRAYLYRWS